MINFNEYNNSELKKVLKAAIDYKSSEDLCRAVYLGGIAKAGMCAILNLPGTAFMDSQLMKNEIEKADRPTLEHLLVKARPVVVYMLKNPVEKCSCCGQIKR